MASLTLDLLHTAYAGPFASKRMARDGRVSFRTAEKWWAGLTTPRADVLLRLAQENEALRAVMLRALQGGAYAGVLEVGGTVRPEAGGVVAQPGGTVREGHAHAVAGPVGEGA